MVHPTRISNAIRTIAICALAIVLASVALVPVTTTNVSAATKASGHVTAEKSYRGASRRAKSHSSNSYRSKSRSAWRKARVASHTKRRSKSSYVASAGSRSGGVTWAASASCLAGNLKSIVHAVAARFGAVRVNSTCRSKGGNRRVGGAGKSWHLSGNAVDLRVFGNVRGAAAYLRSAAGGYKHYGGGLFHIDNGPNRSW